MAWSVRKTANEIQEFCRFCKMVQYSMVSRKPGYKALSPNAGGCILVETSGWVQAECILQTHGGRIVRKCNKRSGVYKVNTFGTIQQSQKIEKLLYSITLNIVKREKTYVG